MTDDDDSRYTEEPDYMIVEKVRVGLSKGGAHLALQLTGELHADDIPTGMRVTQVVAFTPEMAEDLVGWILDVLGAPE